jgi:hypothetical protein
VQNQPLLAATPWVKRSHSHNRPAELGVADARLYGLSRDELRYVLDPQECMDRLFRGDVPRADEVPIFSGTEKEMKVYGDAAQSGEAARVGEVGGESDE